MSLRAFIVSACGGVIILIACLFYVRADKVLTAYFSELEEDKHNSAIQSTDDTLKSRSESLVSFGEHIGSENKIGRTYIDAAQKNDLPTLKTLLKTIRTRTECDFVEIMDMATGQTIEMRHIDDDKFILKHGQHESSGILIRSIKNEPALISYSPLRYVSHVEGILVLGNYLNSEIAEKISHKTHATIRFFAEKQAGTDSIDISNGHDGSIVAHALIKTSFLSRIKTAAGGSIVATAIICLLLAFILVCVVLYFGFLKAFQWILGKVRRLGECINNDEEIFLEEAKKFFIKEMTILCAEVCKLYKTFRAAREREARKTRNEEAGERFANAGHAIDGELITIECLLMNAYERGALTEEEKDTIDHCFSVARSTTSELRAVREANRQSPAEIIENAIGRRPARSIMVLPVVDRVVKAKRVKCPSGISIDSQGDFGLFIRGDAPALARELTSIVNNAVEAITGTGTVTVRVFRKKKNVYIEVKDTGRGIPEAIRRGLCKLNATFGKGEKGTGFGLYFAKELMTAWGGDLDIKSKVGRGTTVSLMIPEEKAPAWFLSELVIPKGAEIVIVDDEQAIHNLWEKRLKDHCLRHFVSANEFAHWMKNNRYADVVCLDRFRV